MVCVDISPTRVSRITNAVIEQVVEWQSCPLDAIYYLDCILLKTRQDKRVNKSISLALAINTEWYKKLLGI